MLKATVKKLDGTYLDHSNFASEDAAMEWFGPRIDQGVYGQKHVPAQYQTVTVVIQEALLDEQGEEISPAVTEDHEDLVREEIAAQFVIEFEEITELSILDPEQERINSEAKAYLASTDWYVIRMTEIGVPIPEAVSQARQFARSSIVE
jgi:hypothetical protein